jgi:hypothetical protein
MTIRSDLAKVVDDQRNLGTSLVPIGALERILDKYPRESNPWAFPILLALGIVGTTALAIVLALSS